MTKISEFPAASALDGTESVPVVQGGVTKKVAASELGYPPFSGAVLTKSALQSIPDNTITAVTFDGEVVDTDGYHDNATNPSRLTAPVAGWYLAGGTVEMLSMNTGSFVMTTIRKNGATVNGDGRARETSVSADIPSMFFGRPVQLAAGDYVELTVHHNHGSARDARPSSDGTSLWIVRIA